jgi:hypothetical protein
LLYGGGTSVLTKIDGSRVWSTEMTILRDVKMMYLFYYEEE